MSSNSQKIKFEFEGLSKDDMKFLFDNDTPPFGLKKKLSDGVEVENRTAPTLGFDPVSIVTVFITISTSIATSVAANIIYDWLKERISNFSPQEIEAEIKKEQENSASNNNDDVNVE